MALTSTHTDGQNSQRTSVKTISDGTPVDSLLAEFVDLTHPVGVQRKVRHNTVHIRTVPGDHGDWHWIGSVSPN
jgi:hypothetical protein